MEIRVSRLCLENQHSYIHVCTNSDVLLMQQIQSRLCFMYEGSEFLRKTKGRAANGPAE